MKISKRQLKRIIREEYTLLKRKGLIRESMGHSGMGGLRDRLVDEMRMYLDDLMASPRGMDLEYGGREAIVAELSVAFPEASELEIMEAMDSF